MKPQNISSEYDFVEINGDISKWEAFFILPDKPKMIDKIIRQNDIFNWLRKGFKVS